MMPQEREQHDRRWQEIEAEIQAIHAGKVVDGSPAETERRLADEQDEIEYLLGMADFGDRPSPPQI